MVDKYFPDEDPVGKILVMDGRQDYIVTGVVEDVPENSHFHYDFLASLASRGSSRNTSWASQNNFPTYFLLRENASIEAVESKLEGLIERHVHPEVQSLLNVSPEQFYASGNEFGYVLQPLTDIHLTSHARAEHETNGNILYIYIFTAIAIAILLIACVNYVNLSTAISTGRAREVGIRKSVGSSRTQLVSQFLVDSVLLSIVAVGVAVVVAELSLPWLNAFTGKNLHIAYSDGITVPALILLALTLGLIAGSYPSFYLSPASSSTLIFNSTIVPLGKSPCKSFGITIIEFSP